MAFVAHQRRLFVSRLALRIHCQAFTSVSFSVCVWKSGLITLWRATSMATIHPSRLGLVPQDSNRQRGRSPSPRLSRPHEPSSPRSPVGGRSKYNDGNDGRRRDERDGDRAKHRARADDYFEGDRKDRAKERSRSIDRQRDREREDRHLNDRVRRPSPEYSEYRRPSPPHLRREDPAVAAPPWKQQETMYPSRRGGPPMNGYGGGGSDFMDGFVYSLTYPTGNI